MKKLLLLFAMVAYVGSAYAWDYFVNIGNLYYYLNATTHEAQVTWKSYANQTRYINTDWDIATANIPSEVYYNSEYYNVKSIGDYAFYNCSNLSSVTIADGIESIGKYAFSGYSTIGSSTFPILTSITIPNTVTEIKEGAFCGCSGLTSIDIPNSVEYIRDGVFSRCYGLTTVTLGKNLRSIGERAFDACADLTSLIWNAKNCSYRCEFGDKIESVVFGNEVEVIPSKLCSGQSNLTTITIPNSVKTIKSYTFENCTGLTSVRMGTGIEDIESSAFYGCSNLNSVHISDIAGWCRIEFGGEYSNPLYYATHLYLNEEAVTDLVIPEGIESIHSYAFNKYGLLTSVTIPNSVTFIGSMAFKECSSLTSITIGNGVKKVNEWAFFDCSNLTSVHISDIAAWCGISFLHYYSNPLSYAHHLYLNDELVTDLVIPDGVESIGAYAFYGCSDIKTMTIGNTVTSFGAHILSWDCGLESITCFAQDVPRIIEETFIDLGNKPNIPLYVPEGCEQAYLDDEYWSEFNVQVLGAEAIENIRIEGNKPTKLFHDGQVYILRGEKAYTLQGQEAK